MPETLAEMIRRAPPDRGGGRGAPGQGRQLPPGPFSNNPFATTDKTFFQFAWALKQALPEDATEVTLLSALEEQYSDLSATMIAAIGAGRWAVHFHNAPVGLASRLQHNGVMYQGKTYDFEQLRDTSLTGLLRVDITGWCGYSLDDAAAALEFQRILDDVEVRTQPTRPGAVAATVKGIATVNRFIQVRDASTPKLGT